jgi:hypothetical protein
MTATASITPPAAPAPRKGVLQQLARPPLALFSRHAGLRLRELDVLGSREHRQQKEPLEYEANLAEPEQAPAPIG